MLLELLAFAETLAAVPSPSPTSRADSVRLHSAQGASSGQELLPTLDFERLTTDRTYAGGVLREVDRAVPAEPDPQRRVILQTVRALALVALERQAEAKVQIEQLAAADHPEAANYLFLLSAAALLDDPVLIVRSIEGMARRLGSNDPAEIFEQLTPEYIWSLNGRLRALSLPEERVRLAQALVSMGWRRSEPGVLDGFRLYLIGHRLTEGRRTEAQQLARELRSPDAVVPLLVLRHYDGVLPDGAQTLLVMLEEEDRGTASALAAAPTNPEVVLRRIDFLRNAGRNAEAVEVARPFLADLGRTVATGRHGPWIVNNAAYAMLATGRTAEAAELLRGLTTLDMADYGDADLISANINYGGMLWEAGRPADSLAHIARLRPLAADRASDFGHAWIAAYAVCSHFSLQQAGQAQADLDWLKERPTVNAAALNLALLCANDLDASERHVINRLQSGDPGDILLAMQDYAVESPVPEALAVMQRRFAEVRDRPAVREALAQVGQIRTLPIARVYHGTF